MDRNSCLRISEKLCARTKKTFDAEFLEREGALKIPNDGDYVLCLGDSFTYGHGVDPDKTFPCVLGAMLPDMVAINGGIQGASTRDMLTAYRAFGGRTNLRFVFLMVMDIILMRPHVVTGVTNQDDGIDLQDYQARISCSLGMFDEIGASCADIGAKPVLVHWPRHPFRLKSNRLSRLLGEYCGDRGIHFLDDLHDYLSLYNEGSLILCSTDWHPSVTAHRVVAGRLQRFICGHG